MVVGVTRCVHRSHGGTLHAKDLTVYDRLLRGARRVLVYRRDQIRIHADEIGDPASVVAVPVGEKDV